MASYTQPKYAEGWVCLFYSSVMKLTVINTSRSPVLLANISTMPPCVLVKFEVNEQIVARKLLVIPE